MATVATIADTTIVGDNEDQLVTMIVDNQLFGIPILQVQDIVEASKITPVPLAPSAIAGVLNLRGRIVTVVDLRKLLGNNEEVPWESQMGVTVEFRGDLYTLLVDAIGDVRTLPKRDFDKAPSTMEDNIRRLCSGIYRLRGNLLVVLDVARILHSDVIDATPMLTVEERRARKKKSVGDSDGGEARAHQLSALMTDLNAYESETEGVFGATSDTGTDDIKARKRAGRDRRSVAERWREVLAERARKSGQTVYRMREPDEETVEKAREEMAQEDDEWAARVIDPDNAPPAGEDAAPPAPYSGLEEAAPDLPPPSDFPAFGDGPTPTAADDLPSAEGAAPDRPTDSPPAEESEPAALDAAPDLPPEPTETAPAPIAEPAAPSDLPPEQPEAAAPPAPEPAAQTDQPTTDGGSAVTEPAAASDTAAPDDAAGSPSPARESGGITGGWWNKLRAKTGRGEPAPAEETTPDEPAPKAEATPDDTAPKAKPAQKKPAAKPKAKAKAKPKAKGGAKTKPRAKPKKKS